MGRSEGMTFLGRRRSVSSSTRLHVSLVDTLLSLDFGTVSDSLSTVASSAQHFLEPVIGVEHELSAKSALFLGHHPELWRDVNFLSNGAHHAWEAYGNALRDHPLVTKSATATTLAITGDAVAQFSAMSSSSSSSTGGQTSNSYDIRRALSLGLFAALYTGAFQHFWFGWLNSHLAFEASLISPTMAILLASPLSPGVLAALKVSVNQFCMVPFVYMPMFFALTGAVSGMSAGESWERAKGLFTPLLLRNYAFWLPAQLIQFAFVPPEFQITYLCTAGLFWNMILSAASAGGSSSQQPHQNEASITKTETVYAYAEDAVSLSDVGDVLSEVGDEIGDVLSDVGDVLADGAGVLAYAAEDVMAETKHALSDGVGEDFLVRSSPVEGNRQDKKVESDAIFAD